MALRKFEIDDNLLEILGSTKSPKELGEICNKLIAIGLECENLDTKMAKAIKELSAFYTAEQVGDLVSKGKSFEALDSNTLFLLQQALETSKKLGKDSETTNKLKDFLKGLNNELMGEL